MSKLKINIPETLFLVGTLVYWLLEGALYNPLAMIFSLIFLQQIIFKNAYLGVFIASILLLISSYASLAVFSELLEFPNFNPEAGQLLLGAVIILGPITFFAIQMLRSYLKNLRKPISA